MIENQHTQKQVQFSSFNLILTFCFLYTYKYIRTYNTKLQISPQVNFENFFLISF